MNQPYNKLSYSQIYLFNSCRYRWWLKYVKGIKRRVQKPFVNLGIMVHAGIAAGITEEDDFLDPVKEAVMASYDDLTKKWAGNPYIGPDDWREAEATRDRAMVVTARALDYIRANYVVVRHPNTNEPLVEMEMEVPGWAGFDAFHGYLDAVLQSKATGHMWLTDWKIRESFQSTDWEEFNLQMAAYQYILRETMGIVASGSMALQVKSVEPRVPKMNKTGAMSRQLILTDWDTYKSHLLANGLDPADYEDMREKLSEVEWFRESTAFRGQVEINTIWEEVVVQAGREISLAKAVATDTGGSDVVPLRCINARTCSGCDFQEYCYEMMRGGDPDFLLRHQYKHRDEPDIVPVVEAEFIDEDDNEVA